MSFLTRPVVHYLSEEYDSGQLLYLVCHTNRCADHCAQQFRAKSRAPCVDSLSQFSMESTTSADSREPQFVAAGDIRKRLSDSIAMPKKKFNVITVFW